MSEVAAQPSPAAYDVVAIGITRSGRWVVVPEDMQERLRIVDGTLPGAAGDLRGVAAETTSCGRASERSAQAAFWSSPPFTVMSTRRARSA